MASRMGHVLVPQGHQEARRSPDHTGGYQRADPAHTHTHAHCDTAPASHATAVALSSLHILHVGFISASAAQAA
jgi:hypothetical protein